MGPAELASRLAEELRRRVPPLDGAPVQIRFLPNLHTYRGALQSESRGVDIQGAADLRRRAVTLDESLTRKPGDLRRILIHEMFHFVWVRLGNPRRNSFSHLIEVEFARGARGELGYSAASRKAVLRDAGVPCLGRRWREYICESFCDTAAWRFGTFKRHDEFSLAPRYCARRAAWFREYIERQTLSI